MKHTANDKHLSANDEAEKLTTAFTSISLDDSKSVKSEPTKLKRKRFKKKRNVFKSRPCNLTFSLGTTCSCIFEKSDDLEKFLPHRNSCAGRYMYPSVSNEHTTYFSDSELEVGTRRRVNKKPANETKVSHNNTSCLCSLLANLTPQCSKTSTDAKTENNFKSQKSDVMSFGAVWRELEDAEKALRKWKLQPRRCETFKVHKLFSSQQSSNNEVTSFQQNNHTLTSGVEDEAVRCVQSPPIPPDSHVASFPHEVQTPRSCLAQARQEQDISVNELAAYFDEIVHLPKKMCIAAESMYA